MKMPSLSIKERKAILNKPSDYLISFSSYVDIECSSFKSTKERKAKRRIATKEFNDELLNLVTIQDKMKKIYPINKQKETEIDELYDEYGSLISQLKI